MIIYSLKGEKMHPLAELYNYFNQSQEIIKNEDFIFAFIQFFGVKNKEYILKRFSEVDIIWYIPNDKEDVQNEKNGKYLKVIAKNY